MRQQASPVKLLDVVVGTKEKRVLAIQQNGDVTVFSEDLQTTSLEVSLASHHCEALKVLAIQSLTPSEAKKTILKRRPDILNDTTPETIYLATTYCHIDESRSSNGIRYAVWAIDVAGSAFTSRGKALYPKTDHELAAPGNKGKSSCAFNPRASSVLGRTGQTVKSYDLTGLVPCLSSTLRPTLSGNYEIIPISPAFALCAFQDTLQLYDLNFQSIQAQTNLPRANLKRKRQRGGHEERPLEFIAYFPQSARAIGRQQNQLFAVDIRTGSSRRVLETGGSLLHNIGRGTSRDEALTTNHSNKQVISAISMSQDDSEFLLHWKSTRENLERLAQAGDVSGFEKLFVDDVQKAAVQRSVFHKISEDLPTGRTNIPDETINYLLSKIFEPASSAPTAEADQNGTERGVKIQIPSAKLLLWISSLGLLSGRSIGTIMSSSPKNGETIGIPDIVLALIEVDPSCELLAGCLSNGFSPYVDEQVTVAKVLIQQALDTASETTVADTHSQVNGRTAAMQPSNSSVNPIQMSSSSSESPWLPVALQRALIASLDRLGTAAASTISTNLKASFSQREALALIQFLRQQLFQGGHTRSLQSIPLDGEVPRTVKLDAAVKLLSSCVDAIGPLGFFGGFDNEDFIGNIVPELLTEITNTKQGLEDTSELQGILREVLRYATSMKRQRAAGARIPLPPTGDDSRQRPGAIMTLYTEVNEGEDSFQPGPLPLSLKVENAVSATKLMKDGRVKKRSIRQKRMLERRNKGGQYSFERLVL